MRDQFVERFSDILSLTQGNVYRAFNLLIAQIHREVMCDPKWDRIGTAAVICFVDLAAHCIYTATLGNREANLYRQELGIWTSIPLSLVRDCNLEDGANKVAQSIGVIQKPEPGITMYPLQPGDRLVIACDRLKDCVRESAIIDAVGQAPSAEELAPRLVELALNNMPKVGVQKAKGDNVTVIAIDFGLPEVAQNSSITRDL